MQQPVAEQLADDEGHAAGGVEVVHVRLAVGIDAAQKRHDVGEVGEIRPGELDARRRRHGDDVQRVVGGAAGGVQAHDAVDEGALVQHPAHGRVVVAERRDLHGAPSGLGGEGVAHGGVGVDEGRAGEVHPHDLHHHLVGVGGAVERAGAGAVVGFRLGLEQGRAVDLALGEELADLGFLVVGQAGRHGAGRDEHRRQVAEGQRPDDEARHDLVADAEVDRGVEGLVRQRHRGRERDDFAGEQRQLHAGLALGDAVAHGGHAARHLGDAAGLAGGAPDHLRVALVRLVGRQHVVVGGHDGKIGARARAQHGLVADAAGREAVGLVGAAEAGAPRAGLGGLGDPVEVAPARVAAALDDALGDVAEAGVDGAGAGAHDRPRRAGGRWGPARPSRGRV